MKKPVALMAALLSVMTALAANVVDVSVKALDGFGGDLSSVLARCQTKEGMPYDEVAVTRDVTSLKESGEFQEITAESRQTPEGVEVVFLVRRKVRYSEPLLVEGNAALTLSKITDEAGLKDGNLYSEGDLAAAAEKVIRAYRKKDYPDAKVIPIVVQPNAGSGNDVSIKFLVDEGEHIEVADYIFDGAHNVKAAELKPLIGVYPWWNPYGWFSDEPVAQFDLKKSAETIAKHYRDLGYLDVEVGEPERVRNERGEVEMHFPIEEGPQYKIASLAIKGLTKYPEGVVMEKSDLPKIGAIASEKDLDDAAHRVAVTVGSGDLGLSDTQVTVHRLPRSDSDDVVDIVFAVREGYPVIINNVVIEGNDYTKDKVIRREIELGPGDKMLADRAERSQKKLENLDYFSRVRYYLRETNRARLADGTEFRDLVFEVDETNQRTGNFMIGVGASSVDSVYLSAELSQSNFDLFAPSKMFRGGGQKARAYVQVGPRIQTYEVSITEPHLFDRLLELTVEGYRRMRWFDNYNVIRSGAAASISYPVKFWPTWGAFGRFGFRLSGEFIQLDDVDDAILEYGNKTVSYKDEEKQYSDAVEPVLRVFWARDTRDSFRMPTSGHRSQLFADLAPAGDNTYYRLGLNHRSYFTTWQRFNHVLMFAFRLETIEALSDDVPIYNRMFLGGPKSIRGIKYRGVSPHARRIGTNSWDPWGGQTLLCANLEYTIPIISMFRMAAFTDFGSVGEDSYDLSSDFAWTIGLGARIDIPMFPIRLDFATPIKTPDHAEKEVFSFTVGYDF